MKWYKNLNILISEKFNFLNILFSILSSFIFSCIIYKFLFPICHYSNLNDFYVGISIYENHNKFLDIGIFFIYVILFFFIFFINKIKFPKINFNFSKFNKIFYWLSAGIVLFSGIYFFPNMEILDFHHLGEKIAVYYAHAKFGMKYYQDIMLVHGYLDVIPSFLADKLLGNLNEYNEKLCTHIFQLFLLILNCGLTAIIFKKKSFLLICINILLYLNNFSLQIHYITFTLAYIFMLKISKKINYSLWLIVYYSLILVGLAYHTTFGTAYFIASLPFLWQKINENKKAGLIISILFISLVSYIFGQEILMYLDKAQYYVSSNLYAFGNFYPEKINFIRLFIALSGFLLLPVNLLFLIKTRSVNIKHLIIFTILMTLVMLNYSFGRLDNNDFPPRAIGISYLLFGTILPYLFYRYRLKCFELYNFLVLVITFSIMLNINATKTNNPLKISLTIQKLSLPKLENKMFTKNNTEILDLNNCGMIYYYLDKKPAIAYSSYYNIVNTAQTKEILKKFEQNPPEIIILYIKNLTNNLDSTFIPQRINSIYRWIFLSNQYEFIETDRGYFLKRTNISNKIKPIKELDIISAYDLNYLPDVWGNSTKTLPMKKINKDISFDNNEILFKDLSPIDADLLYVEYETTTAEEVLFKVKMNGLPSILKFKSKSQNILIPIDNYPTWLLQDKIKEIDLNSSKPISIKKVELYKRN